MSEYPQGVSFVLKDKNADKPTPIILLFTHDRKRTKIYTGEAIVHTHWDFDGQKAKTRGYPTSNVQLNRRLEVYAKKLVAHYESCRLKGFIASDSDLKESIKLEEQPEPEEILIPEFWEAYNDFSALNSNDSTRAILNTLKKHLKGFQEKTGYEVCFDSLNLVFRDKFVKYLLDVPKLSDNTIFLQIKTLKRFLNYAYSRGYPVNLIYKVKEFRHERKDGEVLALTSEEVEAIEQVIIPETKKYLQNARKLFLLGIYTGLRISDLKSIQPHQVRPDHLKITTQKTRQALTIPLTIKAKELVDQLLADEIHIISDQRFNEFIKELCQLSGIDTPTEKRIYRNRKPIIQVVPKYLLVTSHVMRKSFITLALERGMRAEVVSKISGHKDPKSFRRYVSVTDDTVMKEFAKVNEMPATLKKVI